MTAILLWGRRPSRAKCLSKLAMDTRMGSREEGMNIPLEAVAYRRVIKGLSCGGKDVRVCHPSRRG